MALMFYTTKGPYGCFSNFSRHTVQIYGYEWPTSEHAFQAMKFHPHRPDLVQYVFRAVTPKEAANIGRDKNLPLRPDWDSPPDKGVQTLLNQKPQPIDNLSRPNGSPELLFTRTKDVIMYEVVRAKVLQNQDILETLLGTGDEVIIEDSVVDPYWGWGASKSGENKLGRILMYTRTILGQGL